MPRRGLPSTVLPRSAAITRMPFEEPYQTPMQPFGAGGLNLRDAADSLDPAEYQRLTNVDIRGRGRLEARWGLASIATTAGVDVHSFKRLDDPLGSQATRIWGVDTELFRGLTGALVQVDTGYSGDPLHLVPKRPEFSGRSWMYVADRSRMRKVRFDGLDLPIGLPAASLTSTALMGVTLTQVLHFGPVDSSEAALWGAPVFIGAQEDWVAEIEDDLDAEVGQAVKFRLRWAGGGGYSPDGVTPGPGSADNRNPIVFWPFTRSLNLDKIATLDAADEDLFQIFMKVNFSISSVRRKDEPDLIANQLEELRIYVVTGDPGTFDPTILPGSTPNQDVNRNAYVKAIRHTELTLMFTGYETWAGAHGLESDVLSGIDFIERTSRGRESARAAAKTDPPQLTPLETPMAVNEWKQFGAPGRPFRRGAFYEIGEPDWSKVIGIFIYQKFHTLGFGSYEMSLDDFRLIGGRGLDTADPTTQPYDVRVTNYDSRTGTEGNPSAVQDEDDRLEPLRNGITATPVAFGDADMRQRFYIRGGTNNTDWRRAGINTADGAAFNIIQNDTVLSTAVTLELDHDEPVTTQDGDGTTIRAQAIPVLIDLGDLLIGLGDPNRPGHLYWSIPGEFGHWPPQNTAEVCPPGEELQGGLAWGGQAYIFSHERMFVAYPNVTSPGTVLVTNTSCNRGLHARWAVCRGERGIYGVDTEGIFVTQGQTPTEVADKLFPLFHRESRQGYLPIDMSVPTAMRLRAWAGRIYFQYRDTGGTNRIAIYDERRDLWLGIWTFTPESGTLEVESRESSVLNEVPIYLGGRTGGDGFALSELAFSDDGTAISCQVLPARWDAGIQRENKQWGDALIDCDPSLTEIAIAFSLDQGSIDNAALTIPSTQDGRRSFILDAFGNEPQFGKTVEADITWSSTNRRPTLHELGVSHIPIPEETNRRSTQWDDLGSSHEKYLTGVELEVDTFGVARPFLVEYDLGGVILTAFDGTVTSTGRHKFRFSWPFVRANLVRIRPDDACAPWILFKSNFYADIEPPTIARLDSNDEEHYDSYYTGLDLIINTFGLTKTLEIFVDGVQLTNPETSLQTWLFLAAGKQVVHLSTTPGYGHIFRWRTTDDNVCKVYSHRWHLIAQPSEQTNLNQGLQVAGTRADKWMKGIVFEIDTANVAKQIRVEVDGTDVETFTVTTPRRQAVQHAFATAPNQFRGRVIRIHSTDAVACRVWPPIEGIFDVEPLALQRVETQEITHGIDGWQTLIMAEICYRSTALVTLTVTTLISDAGTRVTDTYSVELPTTADVKQKRPVFFLARKGLLFKYVFTSPSDFYLYREESELHVQPWGEPEITKVKPFGNDAMDTDRQLRQRPADGHIAALDPQTPSVPSAP